MQQNDSGTVKSIICGQQLNTTLIY